KMIAIHALDAVLDRLLRAIGRVVINDLVRTAVLEYVALLAELTGADVLDLIENKSTGFCTEDVLAALSLRELFAKADFGQAGTVERCSVEVSRSQIPRRIDSCGGFLIRDVSEHVAERGRAKAQSTIQQRISDFHGVPSTMNQRSQSIART